MQLRYKRLSFFFSFWQIGKKSITILHNHKLDTKRCMNLSNSTLRSVSNMSFLLLLLCEQRLLPHNKLKMIWVMFLLKLIWYIPDILNDLFACTASHEKNKIAGLKTTAKCSVYRINSHYFYQRIIKISEYLISDGM